MSYSEHLIKEQCYGLAQDMRCVFLYDQLLNWTDAHQRCRDLDSQLTVFAQQTISGNAADVLHRPTHFGIAAKRILDLDGYYYSV